MIKLNYDVVNKKYLNKSTENLCLKSKNKNLKKTNVQLKKKVKRLQSKSYIEENVRRILKDLFTPKQILNPLKKKVIWKIEDISSAIALRSLSLKSYRYLLKKIFLSQHLQHYVAGHQE